MNWLDVWTLIGIASAFTAPVDAHSVVVCHHKEGSGRRRRRRLVRALLGLFAIAFPILAQGHPHRRILVATLGGLWGLRSPRASSSTASSKPAKKMATTRNSAPNGDRTQPVTSSSSSRLRRFVAALLAIPFAMASQCHKSLHITDYAAAALWLVGFVGESIADTANSPHSEAQPRQQGGRAPPRTLEPLASPNYFFASIRVALLAMHLPVRLPRMGRPRGFMLFLILKVTGIPPTEERALATRGDDYRHYQQTTRAFVPWFPKRERTTPTPKDSAR